MERARLLYEEALRLAPTFIAARATLGVLNIEFFDRAAGFDAAIAEFNETLRLDPDLFLTYFSLKVIYLFELGDLDAAVATIRPTPGPDSSWPPPSAIAR